MRCKRALSPAAALVAAAISATSAWAGEMAHAAMPPAAPVAPASSACDAASGEAHAIVRVTEGNSLILDDGREVTAAGLLFPSPPISADLGGVVSASQASADWPPAQEARAALLALTANVPCLILLEAASDRYGRHAAQIHVDRDGKLIWLQRELVEQGHAIVTSRLGGSNCAQSLLAAESDARSAKRGLWANASYAIRDATGVPSLLRLRSGFAVVEGKVVNVTARSQRLYINFGADWKNDFTVVVPKTLLALSAGSAATTQALADRRVRARGWIEKRYGPSIELFHLNDLEILPGETAQAPQ